MKTNTLKQQAINVAAMAFVSLLGACATTSSPQPASATIQTNGGRSPIVAKAERANGNLLTAREIWGWEPLVD